MKFEVRVFELRAPGLGTMVYGVHSEGHLECAAHAESG